MKDADLGLDTVPTACLEDLLNDCMNLMVMSSSDVTSNASLDTWHLTESCTIPGTMKEDVERSLLDILERCYPGWARNLGQHCGEKVMKDQDSVQQWAHALCTYLSWDEYCQMTTAQLTLQYQEEMADLLMQNPRMSSLARNMDAATMEAIRQMARGRNIEPSDAMKFLHSLVVTASKAARDKEMDHIVQLQANECDTDAGGNGDDAPGCADRHDATGAAASSQQDCSAGDGAKANNDGHGDGGQGQPLGAQSKRADESVGKRSQSEPVQTPAASLPPRRFDDGVYIIGDAIVGKESAAVDGKRKGASGSVLRGKDGGEYGEIRAVRGTIFGDDPSLAPTVCGVQVGPINTSRPTCSQTMDLGVWT